MVDKQRKRDIVTDVAIPSDSNIRKKDMKQEHEKLKKYQGLRDEGNGFLQKQKTWKEAESLLANKYKSTRKPKGCADQQSG